MLKKISLISSLFVLVPLLLFGQSSNETSMVQLADSSKKKQEEFNYQIRRTGNQIEYPYGYSQPIVKCAPLRLSMIILQEGEKILSMSAGDTRRWKIRKAYQGKTGNVIPIIQVKPIADGISTNLIITTDRRIYNILLRAPEIQESDKYSTNINTPRVSFYYPDDQAFKQIGVNPYTKVVKSSRRMVDISKMNMNYEIEVGQYGFPWRPEAVYDNGKQVFIKLPQESQSKILPTFYVVNLAGERQVINVSYNPVTNVLKTDRLFKKGVLIIKFRHPGFLGIGTVTDEKELFIIRQ